MKLKTILSTIVLIIIAYFFRREHMQSSVPIINATETIKNGDCPIGSTALAGHCYSCPQGRILSGGRYCT